MNQNSIPSAALQWIAEKFRIFSKGATQFEAGTWVYFVEFKRNLADDLEALQLRID